MLLKSISQTLIEQIPQKLSKQQQEIELKNNQIFAAKLLNSKYFEVIRDTPLILKKIQRLFEEGNIIMKEERYVICELNAKSNYLYFLLEGALSVFIRKNEQDLYDQLKIFANLESCKKLAETQDVSEELSNLQQQWNKLQKRFDSDLLSCISQYNVSLRSTLPSDEETLPEKFRYLIQAAGPALSREVCTMKRIGEILPINCFGEIGCILGKPRTATVITKIPSTLLMISYKKYQEIFTKDQIYELNFGILNLSQTFANKIIDMEVIGHIASHFYQIPPTQILYKQILITCSKLVMQIGGEREGMINFLKINVNDLFLIQYYFFKRQGDKIDGIYLIQQGHAQIFRTEKNYFNNQVPISIKGKGSLIGIEDYFMFHEGQEFTKLRSEVELNTQKNGRQYTVMIKDLNMIIFKIDKSKLDQFVQGNALFKNHFVEKAFNQFCQFSEKYENNVKLRHDLLDEYPLKFFESSNQNKNEKGLMTPKEKAKLPARMIFMMEKKEHLKQENSNNNGEIIKVKQKVEFPDIMKSLNSNIKDFESQYQLNKSKIIRSSNKQNLSYDNRRISTDEDFISHLEVKKKFFVGMKKKSGNEYFEDSEFDDIQDIDDLLKHNQQSSLKFISLTKKNEKPIQKIIQIYDKEDNTQENISSSFKENNQMSHMFIKEKTEESNQINKYQEDTSSPKRGTSIQKINNQSEKEIKLPQLNVQIADTISKKCKLKLNIITRNRINLNEEILPLKLDIQKNEESILSPLEKIPQQREISSFFTLPRIHPKKQNNSIDQILPSSFQSSTNINDDNSYSHLLANKDELPSQKLIEDIAISPSYPKLVVFSNINCSSSKGQNGVNFSSNQKMVTEPAEIGFKSKRVSNSEKKTISSFSSPIKKIYRQNQQISPQRKDSSPQSKSFKLQQAIPSTCFNSLIEKNSSNLIEGYSSPKSKSIDFLRKIASAFQKPIRNNSNNNIEIQKSKINLDRSYKNRINSSSIILSDKRTQKSFLDEQSFLPAGNQKNSIDCGTNTSHYQDSNKIQSFCVDQIPEKKPCSPISTNPSFPNNKISFRSPSKGIPLFGYQSPYQIVLISKQNKNGNNCISNLFPSKGSSGSVIQ